MDIYGIKTCDSCRKAIKALSDARFVDLRKDGITPDLLARAYAEFGDAIVNKKSATMAWVWMMPHAAWIHWNW